MAAACSKTTRRAPDRLRRELRTSCYLTVLRQLRAHAALQSAILAPGLFRCAVGLAGVYDLTLMSSIGDIPQRRKDR